MKFPCPLPRIHLIALAAGWAFAVVSDATAAESDKVRFNEQVRPILATCFYCHGPDEKHREAGLRLDVRESAIRDNDGIRAIVPGKPDESDLIIRVSSTDEDEVMPPPKGKKPLLRKDEIAVLRKWIEQGAEYEGHWSYQPLSEAPPPSVEERRSQIAGWERREPVIGAQLRAKQSFLENWARNPIDQFILERLLREGVVPSPEADPATLCRRVYLDLLGLLPSPEEIEAFVAASKRDSESALRDLTNRLLASPHYGERWGRHWLDQARYADSNGYSIDRPRVMWPYRDWVIKALNDDLPFDRFTIEQLAGDLLPGATKAQRVASAFHRNTLINEEGGSDPEQFRVEAAMDRVATTGTVWLGLTVGCAQCHTHKFDPITHREYFGLFAFFNSGADKNDIGPTVPVAQGEIFGTGPTAEERQRQLEAERAQRQATWEKTELARATAPATPTSASAAKWTPVEYLEYRTLHNASFRVLDDNSLLSDQRGSFNDTYRVIAKTSLQRVAAVRLRVLTDDSLPNRGPGLAKNGNFVLTDFEVRVNDEEVAIERAFTDHEQPDYPVAAAIDDESKTGWAINVPKGSTAQMNADHEAVFVFIEPVAAETLEVLLSHGANANYLIGRFALDFSETAPRTGSAQSGELSAALGLTPEQRNAAQKKLVDRAFAKADTPRKKSKEIDLDAPVVEQMVMEELPQPRETFLLQRGDFTRPDKGLGPLQPGVLAVVNAAYRNPPAEFKSRLDLARWLVSPENPLTPRVTMNRVWMHYFGRGLVETEEDFGSQGTSPTHPELLDWLGREWIRRGWSMKEMHRLIVTSATYRQSSDARRDLAEKDPRNLLLARQERLRVEGEIIRDAALCASGLLDRTIGGPSVRPSQPDGVFAFTQTKKAWLTSEGSTRFRRGLYTMFYRSSPYPLLTTFDAPNFQTTCTRRPRSNTPLQSLTIANDPVFLEIAQGFAGRLVRELPAATLDERLQRAFVIALGRTPSEQEISILSRYAREQATDLGHDLTAARAIAGAELAESASPTQAAALVAAARVIFNTDAFITRE